MLAHERVRGWKIVWTPELDEAIRASAIRQMKTIRKKKPMKKRERR